MLLNSEQKIFSLQRPTSTLLEGCDRALWMSGMIKRKHGNNTSTHKLLQPLPNASMCRRCHVPPIHMVQLGNAFTNTWPLESEGFLLIFFNHNCLLFLITCYFHYSMKHNLTSAGRIQVMKEVSFLIIGKTLLVSRKEDEGHLTIHTSRISSWEQHRSLCPFLTSISVFVKSFTTKQRVNKL